MTSNHAAYVSRLLEERYHHLQALVAHAHLNKEHMKDVATEMRIIEEIQMELVPR